MVQAAITAAARGATIIGALKQIENLRNEIEKLRKTGSSPAAIAACDKLCKLAETKLARSIRGSNRRSTAARRRRRQSNGRFG